MMDAASGAGTVYPPRAPEFTPGFLGVCVAQYLVFCELFCRSCFVFLSFFFWPLYCLSFFDLWLLNIPGHLQIFHKALQMT